MPSIPQHNLPQQFGRFLLAGAFVFAVSFWFITSLYLPTADAQRDRLALVFLAKAITTQTFAQWLQNLENAYLPLFLGQRPLVASYLVSVPLAWVAAWLYDIKILRKENIV
jgi:hypothetical protein